MFGGIGPDIVLECAGTKESMDQALRSARPGGPLGFAGVPAGGPELPVSTMYGTNIGPPSLKAGRRTTSAVLSRALARAWVHGEIRETAAGLSLVR